MVPAHPPLKNAIMKLKTAIAITCMISAGTLTASADPKVIVDPAQEGAPSQETALSVDTKITFTSTGVQIENGGDTRAFTYADIGGIRFVTSTSSVTVIERDAKYALRTNPVETELEITGHAGTPVPLSIFSLNGQQMLSTLNWQGETLNAATLAPGTYLVRINNETFKFIKK